jgi:hypothetical protein
MIGRGGGVMDRIVFFSGLEVALKLRYSTLLQKQFTPALSFFVCGCGFWESFCAFVCWPRPRQEMERRLNPEWI